MRRAWSWSWSWMTWLGLAAGLGGSLAGADRALAQPRRAPPGEVAGPDDARGPAQAERREQIKKKIRTMRAFTLTDELALDEPTAGRLFPVLARYDDEIDKLLQRRVELQRRLRQADTIRNGREIERLIDDAIANQRAFRELEDRKITELRKILTPVQMAKLLVVLPALERKIQNQLRKAIVGRRGGNKDGRGGKFAPNEDDDDTESDEDRGPRREAPLPAPAPRGMPSSAPGNTPPCDPRSGPCR